MFWLKLAKIISLTFILLHSNHETTKLGYRPTRFLQMIAEFGGLGTAKRLLATEEYIQDGIKKLWELERLDSTPYPAALLRGGGRADNVGSPSKLYIREREKNTSEIIATS